MRTVQILSEHDYESLGYLGRAADLPEPIAGAGWPVAGWQGTFADALRMAPAMEDVSCDSWLAVLTRGDQWLEADEYFTLARLLARSVADLWLDTSPAMPTSVKAWLATGNDSIVNDARSAIYQRVGFDGPLHLPSLAEQIIGSVIYARRDWILRLRPGCAFWYPSSTLYTTCYLAAALWEEYPPAPMMWTIRAPGFAEVKRRLLSFIDDGALAPA